MTDKAQWQRVKFGDVVRQVKDKATTSHTLVRIKGDKSREYKVREDRID